MDSHYSGYSWDGFHVEVLLALASHGAFQKEEQFQNPGIVCLWKPPEHSSSQGGWGSAALENSAGFRKVQGSRSKFFVGF